MDEKDSRTIANYRFNDVFSSLPTTIFEKMSRLAADHQSINLGQGFPDRELEGPSTMKDEVTRSMRDESNQYPPMMGISELRQAIADHSLNASDNDITADNVLITLGATEALASSFLGLLNSGDEVIVFAPMYDSYIPMIRRAGATPVTITLCPPGWNFDKNALEAAFTPKTKLIVVNTPHNPTGKVFTNEELTNIAIIMEKFPAVIAICDEVYEHHVYPGIIHKSLSEFLLIKNRCIRIGSAGKTFSFTDFKIGWAVASNTLLVHAVAKAHQFLTFTVNSALQRAVAYGLRHEDTFYLNLGEMLAKKRQYLEKRLTKVGFSVLPAAGTYFLIADFAPLLPRLISTDSSNIIDYDDVRFCTEMTINPGVTLIPVSAFYEKRGEAPKTLVRFVLCKTDEKLKAACDLLETFFER
jgi:L-glutamine---4-(methylsulfanyl)-2-oxobutanoate aminotransferase